MTHEYMTVKEVADLVRVKVETIYRWRKRNLIPQPVRQIRPLIWDGDTIREWVANKAS